jgi:hypothetical protein
MADIRHRLIPEDELHNPKGFTPAINSSVATRDELGQSRYEKQVILPEAQYVDGNNPPPSTVLNDTFVIFDGGGGVVDAGWGGASFNDWTRYDGAEFQTLTPTDQLFYDTTNSVYKNFNGSAWVEFGSAVGTGIQNLTTSEKSALIPSVGDFVYDTDLDSLQRYDGSNWVDLSKGYGIIEVVRDSDNGVPTFYTDLQTALETCKTSGSNNIIKLNSDVLVTAEIVMNDGGTGTGNGYLFDFLTIDLNGFTLSYDGVNSDSVINADLFSIDKTLRIINGKVLRTASTGGYAITIDSCTFETSNLEVEGSTGGLLLDTTTNEAFLGNCKFISNGSSPAVEASGGDISDFIAINTSSGLGFLWNRTGAISRNFYIEANTGNGMQVSSGDCDNFKVFSDSGYAIQVSSSGTNILTNFTAESSSSAAIRRSGFGSKTFICSDFTVKNGGIQNDGSFTKAVFSNFKVFSDFRSALGGNVDNLDFYNGHFETETFSGHTASVRLNNRFENVSFVGGNFETVNFVDSGNVNDSVLKNCNFTCLLDTTAGHAVDVGGIDSGNADFINCTFEVVNAGANCITASSAEAITVLNSSYKGATTPVNANVTVTASTDESNGNRSI